MKQEYINYLTLHEYFIIESEITGRPYIDKSFGCYLFELKSEAEDFTKGIQNTRFTDAKTLTQAVFCNEYYSYGIRKINVKLRERKNMEIPLEKADARRSYFNHFTNGLINRLMETKQKKYLRELNGNTILVPIVIDERKPQSYPSMHYTYVKQKDEKKYYVLFSSMQEFVKWNETQGFKFKPMEIEIEKFKRVRAGSPVITNPISDKLILTDEQLKTMEDFRKEETEN